MKRVCLVSSGTGGHLMPAVALARALLDAGHSASLLTEGRAVESALLERCAAGEPQVEAQELRVGRAGIGAPLRLLQATVAARAYLRDHDVDLVVGAGGRTTVPVALAARSLRLPVFLLEQNVVTGRANRLLMPLAERVYFGLPPRHMPRRGVLTGTPLRTAVGRIDRSAARRNLGLSADVPTILVTGGSQGARVLNEVVPEALGGLRDPIQVVHLSGADQDAEVRCRYGDRPRVNALVRPVVMDMACLYAAADLVICRGGGGTVAELATAGRAALIVPYPHHRDRQQWHNGRVLERAGAAVVWSEAELTAPALRERLEQWLAEPGSLATMGERARALTSGDPCARILGDMTERGALN
ncbi:MAG: UDP-N-acetylglucosamine--N-acetylmuramyl-(pentapeptide) pyrophosphoryl-undecaprenol N-acetylglucosamine transferase [Planctomycetes bacterium]|nr:UDP-N-acetylglucosamine--N-acetylmuramyl-(pentapeptide) pyrophosphoryl-undecaprenol N-acetylglucosamine transferase [Planctomycetota bacterium]MCB9871021.1 UDP-N-acetylglucosamine--N-acetylmuramyl-(pentapeptide) pyrophosphoryl-undecaprenol N-acetylglucosamine transferase [Planctomycetota bacterium]